MDNEFIQNEHIVHDKYTKLTAFPMIIQTPIYRNQFIYLAAILLILPLVPFTNLLAALGT